MITAVTIEKDRGAECITKLKLGDLGRVPSLNALDIFPSQQIGGRGRNTTLGLEARDSAFRTLTRLTMEFRIAGPTSTGVVGT